MGMIGSEKYTGSEILNATFHELKVAQASRLQLNERDARATLSLPP